MGKPRHSSIEVRHIGRTRSAIQAERTPHAIPTLASHQQEYGDEGVQEWDDLPNRGDRCVAKLEKSTQMTKSAQNSQPSIEIVKTGN